MCAGWSQRTLDATTAHRHHMVRARGDTRASRQPEDAKLTVYRLAMSSLVARTVALEGGGAAVPVIAAGAIGATSWCTSRHAGVETEVEHRSPGKCGPLTAGRSRAGNGKRNSAPASRRDGYRAACASPLRGQRPTRPYLRLKVPRSSPYGPASTVIERLTCSRNNVARVAKRIACGTA